MTYVQFYNLSVSGYWNNHTSEPIEACGDRGVVILDGRESKDSHIAIAESECAKRGYIGYSLHKGDSFSRSVTIKPYKDMRT